MADGIYAALSGGVVQLRRLEVIAHNLANAGTVGFKRDRLLVTEHAGKKGERDPFAVVLDRSGADGPSSADPSGTHTDLSQGPTVRTGGALDVAIVGEGFLTVDTPGGARLTRDGRLAIAPDGLLVNLAGQPVRGDAGPIYLPEASELEIRPDGEVYADDVLAGRLEVVRPLDPNALQKVGSGQWDPGAAGFEPIEEPEVVQGFVEGSNVEPVTTLVELIQAQRSFDAGQQMIRAHRDMDQQAIRKLGTAR